MVHWLARNPLHLGMAASRLAIVVAKVLVLCTIAAVGSGVENQNFAVGDAVAYISPSFRESININVKTFKSGATPTAFKIPAPTPEWTAVVSSR